MLLVRYYRQACPDRLDFVIVAIVAGKVTVVVANIATLDVATVMIRQRANITVHTAFDLVGTVGIRGSGKAQLYVPHSSMADGN